MENYEILEILYRSPKSVIYKVRSLLDYNVYAIKKFISNKNSALNEIKTHKSYQTSFVVSIQEYFEDQEDNSIALVLEYCNQGDLKSYIQEHMGNYISERVVARALIQLTYLALYMNFQNIQHRAIIPENILVTSKQQGDEIRLTDFAMAGQESVIRAPCIPAYLPLEFLANNQFTQKSQVWQIGLVIYEMMNQKPLFPLNESVDFIRDIISKGGVLIKLPSQYSKHLKQTIRICLEIKERLRPTIKQLANTSSFQKLLTYYQLSYEEKENFKKWIQFTQEEMGKKKSIIIPDPNFYSTFVRSTPRESEIQLAQFETTAQIQARSTAKSSQSMVRPDQKNQFLIFRQSRLSQPYPINKPQKPIFNRRKRINCSQYNFTLKSSFTSDMNGNKLQFQQEETKLKQMASLKINQLIKVKLEQCIEEIGSERSKMAIETLMKKNSEINQVETLRILLQDQNYEKQDMLGKHLIDVADLLTELRQID